MIKTEIKPFILIGLSIRTTNENGRSNIDCGNLWHKFEIENYVDEIPGKLSNNIFAVYHDYEGDHTKPFSYFIGCSVKQHNEVPAGMQALLVAGGSHQAFKASGKMPDCVANCWKEIWASPIERAYQADFEVYDERSLDWNNAEVDIYVSVK
jgi:predicted transcriptional regulator YdeE